MGCSDPPHPRRCSLGTAACYRLVVLTCALLMTSSHSEGGLNHAVAHSADGGDTWGNASLLSVVGTTCEGSIGRDSSAPPGHVLLASPTGANRDYLGRGNMVVYSLDESNPGQKVVKKVGVWPRAAGYSDFAQVHTPANEGVGAAAAAGPVLLLFEAGGSVYDQGIKISPV